MNHKAKLELTIVERAVIKTSMSFYRKQLKGFEKLLFDIAYTKFTAMPYDNEYDGMELSYIIEALAVRARYMCYLNKTNVAIIYLEMALKVRRAKLQFHTNYAKKLETAARAR